MNHDLGSGFDVRMVARGVLDSSLATAAPWGVAVRARGRRDARRRQGQSARDRVDEQADDSPCQLVGCSPPRASVQQITSKQTAPEIPTPYGFGFSAGGGTFGHGGAYSTNMTVDPAKGLITIFMVQNAGWRSEEGKKIEGLFRESAKRAFAK